MVNDGKRRGTGQGVPRVAHPTPKQGRPLQIMVRGRPLTAERIRRVERRARRAARARRRFIVSILLLLSSVAAWTLVGFDRLHWGLAVTPSAMLLFVLFLGQRAARAARRADARWTAIGPRGAAARHAGPRPRERWAVRAAQPGAGRRPGDTRIRHPDAGDPAGRRQERARRDPRRPGEAQGRRGPGGSRGPSRRPEEQATKADEPPGGRAWDPVPVPLPTYVTKPAAPQRQPIALPARRPAKGPTARGRRRTSGHLGASWGVCFCPASAGGRGDAVAEDELMRGEPPRMKSETLATPLEEILARRRAAG